MTNISMKMSDNEYINEMPNNEYINEHFINLSNV